MKIFVLTLLAFFDFFHKKKIIYKLRPLLKNNNIIIFDVGAHHGESIFFLKKRLSVSRIFTFEPLKSNFYFLKKNTVKFNKSITYCNFALGHKKEKRNIKEMTETSSSTLNEINEESNYYKKKKFLLGIKKNKSMFKERKISIDKASNIIKKLKIKKIDLLKIDTEGYEYNVIKGFGADLKKVRVILFEHHYDLMIKKKYKFKDINKYLVKRNFKIAYKFKMPFRKTFEYIYINKKEYNAE